MDKHGEIQEATDDIISLQSGVEAYPMEVKYAFLKELCFFKYVFA